MTQPQKTEHPACIHCGRPIHNTDNAVWWDINEVAGWLCWRSKSYNAIKVYNKIRERLAKGLIDVSNHVPPPSAVVSTEQDPNLF